MRTIEATDTLEQGEYFAGERELFRIEQVLDGRVLLEDCRTEALIEVPIAELSRLRRVERGAGARSSSSPATAGPD